MTDEELRRFSYDPEKEEVIDGEVYCKKCGKQISRMFDMKGLLSTHRIFRIVCPCVEAEEAKRKREMKALERMARMEELKKQSSIGQRYCNVTFDNTVTGQNISFDKAFERCKSYCQSYSIVLEQGLGLYIYGDSGTGKTHLAACMANELLKYCVPVLVTNFYEVAEAIKLTYNRNGNENKLINQFTNIEFLMLDDLGTEIVRKNGQDNWLQEKIFEIINKRYNAMKPTIFTSNYSIGQLTRERGIMEKTVDRITEMSSLTIHITGESLRRCK